MAKKSTYEELEQRIKELEEESVKSKRIEAALRESEERYRQIFNIAPAGIYEVDFRTGKLVNVNDAICEYSGYTKDELLSMNAIDLLTEESKKRFLNRTSKILKGESIPNNVEYAIYKRDGSEIWLSINNKFIYEGDDLVGATVIAQDTTEHRKVEEALRESEERYRELFERSLDCIYIHDFEGNFIDANPNALDLLGYTKEGITSLNFASLLSEDQLLMAFNELRGVIEKGVQNNLSEYKIRKKNGDYVYVESKGSLIHKDGEPYAIMGIARDITERKQADEKLMKLYDELEKRVEKRTRDLAKINKELGIKTVNLEETNTAMKVLLKRRNEDKLETEEKILANINELIKPLIDTLKGTKLDKRQSTCLEILETNLRDIVSPFSRELGSKYWRLTPMEFKVANFVRSGKTTKEIAELLHLATSTI
ncbi:MAG: PAS domain S-box protein [Deltaproteobacteria bacterium]|nr:PAS domain S-box protein [Deltaproteobacteria bacterium]